MSESGHKRKSSVGLGMSAFGGKAEVDFGRLDVCSSPILGVRRVKTQGSAPGAEQSRYSVPSVLELQAGQRPECVLASDVASTRHLFNQGPVIWIIDQRGLICQ